MAAHGDKMQMKSAIRSDNDGQDREAMRRNVADAVFLLKSLANEGRLTILCLLVEGEAPAGLLHERVGLSESAVLQHLAVLREQGLVQTRREGQTVFYRLADTPALDVISLLHDIYCAG